MQLTMLKRDISGKKRTALSGLKLFTSKYKTARVIVVGSPGIEIGKFLETPIIKWLD